MRARVCMSESKFCVCSCVCVCVCARARARACACLMSVSGVCLCAVSCIVCAVSLCECGSFCNPLILHQSKIVRLNRKNRRLEEDFGAVITGLHLCPEIVLDAIRKKKDLQSSCGSTTITSSHDGVGAEHTSKPPFISQAVTLESVQDPQHDENNTAYTFGARIRQPVWELPSLKDLSVPTCSQALSAEEACSTPCSYPSKVDHASTRSNPQGHLPTLTSPRVVIGNPAQAAAKCCQLQIGQQVAASEDFSEAATHLQAMHVANIHQDAGKEMTPSVLEGALNGACTLNGAWFNQPRVQETHTKLLLSLFVFLFLFLALNQCARPGSGPPHSAAPGMTPIQPLPRPQGPRSDETDTEQHSNLVPADSNSQSLRIGAHPAAGASRGTQGDKDTPILRDRDTAVLHHLRQQHQTLPTYLPRHDTSNNQSDAAASVEQTRGGAGGDWRLKDWRPRAEEIVHRKIGNLRQICLQIHADMKNRYKSMAEGTKWNRGISGVFGTAVVLYPEVLRECLHFFRNASEHLKKTGTKMAAAVVVSVRGIQKVVVSKWVLTPVSIVAVLFLDFLIFA